MTPDLTISDHPFRPPMPRQLSLPGQAGVADGPLDLTMMYVMHHAFRRDLAALAAAAAATPSGDRVAWRELGRRWDLFAYVLHHHHTGEDEGYWPLLRTRVAPVDLEVLDAMAAEHDRIDPLLAACGAGFARMAREPGDAERRRDLVANLDRAGWHLDGHLAHEETAALPLLQACLTPEEDEAIEREHFRGGVPVRRVVAVVPWVLHELPEEARERVLAHAGPAYRLVWLLTRGRFARRDRRAMRHA